MIRPFTMRSLLYPKKRHVWARVRILHETDKAVLVDNGMKMWIPKLRILDIRLKGNTFEICTKEGLMG